jgi:hypothetical protein
MLKEFHKIHEDYQQNTNLLRIIENSSENCVKSITNSSSLSKSALESIHNVTENIQKIVEKQQNQHNQNSNLLQKCVVDNSCETKLKHITEVMNQQFPKILTDMMSSKEQAHKAHNQLIMQQN